MKTTQQLRLEAYKSISPEAYAQELKEFVKWRPVHNKISKLKKLAPWSTMIDVNARYEGVLRGTRSFKQFNQFLTAEIKRFKVAE
jgi:hypothetical protein